MSMRQRVGRQEIERFLVQVGRTRQSGRLYLVGGAALVHRGIRPGQTLDIDIQITIDPANQHRTPLLCKSAYNRVAKSWFLLE